MISATRLVPAGYRGVLANPAFRRLLAALSVSYLGDGMSVVAVSWLAIQIAPPQRAGVVVGAAVAAYALPAALGALVLAPWLGRVDARRLTIANAGLRAVALGAAASLALLGRLTPGAYVGLLAVSAVLAAWGMAGTYTMISQLFRIGQRLPANALVGTVQTTMIIIGPALAGLIVAGAGPGLVLAIDALTYLLLAVQVSRIGGLSRAEPDAGRRPDSGSERRAEPGPARRPATGFRLLARRPELVGLLAVTAVFFFLYGPVEVALPLFVVHEQAGSAGFLGAYWVVFGIGALLGGLAGGLLTRVRQWPLALAVIAGWGLALLPFGFTTSAWATMTCFALGGLIYGPFPAFNLALFQNAAEPVDLPAVLAARGAITTAATPLGAAAGGPLVAALGAGGILFASGAATVALALLAATVLLLALRRRARAGAPTPAAQRRGAMPAAEQGAAERPGAVPAADAGPDAR